MALMEWEEVKKEITGNKENNNLLLGNGFSIAYLNKENKEKSFNMQDLMQGIEYLKDIGEKADNIDNIDNIESLIKNIEGDIKNEIYFKLIKERIHIDFINQIFKIMDKKITTNVKNLNLFGDYLKIFNNYFTLNYDPILFWLLLSTQKKKTKEEIESDTKQLSEGSQKNLKLVKNKIDNLLRDKKIKILVSDENNDLKDITGHLKKYKSLHSVTLAFLKEKFPELLNEKKDIKKEYKKDINFHLDSNIEIYLKEGKESTHKKKFDIRVNTKIDGKDTNLFFLHGAFNIFEKEKDLLPSDGVNTMINNIEDKIRNGEFPITVLSGTAKDKKDVIEKDKIYLSKCYEQLEKKGDTLVTLGVRFLEPDFHILEAINNNQNIRKLYLGYFESKDEDFETFQKRCIDNINNKNIKVVFYKTNDVFEDTPD